MPPAVPIRECIVPLAGTARTLASLRLVSARAWRIVRYAAPERLHCRRSRDFVPDIGGPFARVGELVQEVADDLVRSKAIVLPGTMSGSRT